MNTFCSYRIKPSLVALFCCLSLSQLLVAVDAPTEDRALHYGDSLCLQKLGLSTNFYLATQKTDTGVVNRVMGQAATSGDSSTTIYIQPGLSATRWTGCGPTMTVNSGDYVRLEVAPLATSANPTYLAYDFSTANNTAKLFAGAFAAGSPTGVSTDVSLSSLSPNSGYVFKIFKINTTSPDPVIHVGDHLVLMAYVNKTGAGLSPVFFGAQQSGSLQNEADVFCSSTGINSYPTDFPNNYCWFVAASSARAFNSSFPQLNVASTTSGIGDAALVTQQDTSAWPAQNPNFSTVSPPTPTVIRYGDGFALKHKTFGFYISTNGDSYDPCFGTQTLSNTTRYVLMPYIMQQADGYVYKWAGTGGILENSLVLQPVKSGDIVVFSDYNGNKAGFDHSYVKVTATVSIPSPPYCAVGSHQDGASRIFKKGGCVGDIIYSTDDVYVIHCWGQFPVTKSPAFLGSSNKDWMANKEVFWYNQPIDTETPPDFTTNYLWNFDQYQPAAYKNIPNYNNNGNYTGISAYGYDHFWAPYFVDSSSAKYIAPAKLQH